MLKFTFAITLILMSLNAFAFDVWVKQDVLIAGKYVVDQSARPALKPVETRQTASENTDPAFNEVKIEFVIQPTESSAIKAVRVVSVEGKNSEENLNDFYTKVIEPALQGSLQGSRDQEDGNHLLVIKLKEKEEDTKSFNALLLTEKNSTEGTVNILN